MKVSSTIAFALLAILTPSLAFPISLNQAAVDEPVNVKRAVTSFGEALFDKRSPGVSVSSALEGLFDSLSSRIDSNWAHEPNNQMLPKRSPRASIDKALEDLSGSDQLIDPNWAHEPNNQMLPKRSPRASIDKALEDLSGSDQLIDPNWAHEPGNIFAK